MKIKRIPFLIIPIIIVSCNYKSIDAGEAKERFNEQHRLQYHFSPKKMWMNDPNGMVYYDGEYHLFFQHTPHLPTPDFPKMHWGHAVSTDLVHWEELAPAIAPDENGAIFSGSAVVDHNNTARLQSGNEKTLVSIFTYNPADGIQSQGIAYSNDRGRTWIKYENNPVLQNQGVADFRDPKVFWYDKSQKWIMTLAVKDHVELYSSPDLKSWTKESEFGQSIGAHGGVWECPDLFKSKIENESGSRWVMIVSINPGGPNGGSGTQYFVGDFDGTTFKPDTEKGITNWLDHGPDNYAGVTWSNAPTARKIFLGWMSNWAYAEKVPTSGWRGAMTIARDLVLTKVDDRLRLKSTIAPEISNIVNSSKSFDNFIVEDSVDLNKHNIDFSKSIVSGSIEAKDFRIELFNKLGQQLSVGFDEKNKRFFLDRGKSGNTTFSKAFRSEVFAPRISSSDKINFTFVSDVSSLEIFFDGGISIMTSVFFPDEPLSQLRIKSTEPVKVENLEAKQLNSIWQ